jgi:hypothetical protein
MEKKENVKEMKKEKRNEAKQRKEAQLYTGEPSLSASRHSVRATRM